MWNKKRISPKDFSSSRSRLENLVDEKLSKNISLGDKAGELTSEMAGLTGLNKGTAVAISMLMPMLLFPLWE